MGVAVGVGVGVDVAVGTGVEIALDTGAGAGVRVGDGVVLATAAGADTGEATGVADGAALTVAVGVDATPDLPSVPSQAASINAVNTAMKVQPDTVRMKTIIAVSQATWTLTPIYLCTG